MTVPELFTLTLPSFSSISNTSIGPAGWPSARTPDHSFGCPAQIPGIRTFSNTHFLLNVVMPAKTILGKAIGGGT
jgi:hypothetical protein